MSDQESNVDVVGTAGKLAEIMKEDSSAIDRLVSQAGDRFLVFFQDANFTDSFKDLRSKKIEVIQSAIDDLSQKGRMLGGNFIGVSFLNGAMETFICEYGQSPEGNVVYKIGLKDVAAFLKWRNGQNDDINQDTLNAGIYRLTLEWSRLL